MTIRPQFRLRSLFIFTAIVAVGCLVGPPLRAMFWPYIVDEGGWHGDARGMQRIVRWSDGTETIEWDTTDMLGQMLKRHAESGWTESVPAPSQASPPTE
jgi:hypothetical protein